MFDPAFHRLQVLLGEKTMDRLAATRVILFGVGGVGSWCAEGLVRNGIRKLTIVDSDLVCVTNINRQLQATRATVGHSKVDTLGQRLLDINPDLELTRINDVYEQSNGASYGIETYDYVIDAIDSLSAKVDLIDRTLKAGVTLFSALGASCKIDATRIRIDSMWKTRGCPLAKFVRKRLRNRGQTGDFLCVHSDEQLPAFPSPVACGTGNCVCPSNADGSSPHEWCSAKKQINGTAVHITAIYGFMLSGLVLQDVVKKVADSPPPACNPTLFNLLPR